MVFMFMCQKTTVHFIEMYDLIMTVARVSVYLILQCHLTMKCMLCGPAYVYARTLFPLFTSARMALH